LELELNRDGFMGHFPFKFTIVVQRYNGTGFTGQKAREPFLWARWWLFSLGGRENPIGGESHLGGPTSFLKRGGSPKKPFVGRV